MNHIRFLWYWPTAVEKLTSQIIKKKLYIIYDLGEQYTRNKLCQQCYSIGKETSKRKTDGVILERNYYDPHVFKVQVNEHRTSWMESSTSENLGH